MQTAKAPTSNRTNSTFGRRRRRLHFKAEFTRLAEKKSAPPQVTNFLTKRLLKRLEKDFRIVPSGQLNAKAPKGGIFPVVLGPNVVGVFVHEAFGHLAEADLALAGGVLADNMGKKIASNLVTFYDDGTVDGAFGSFRYDDEGTPAQKTLLIKDGVVTGLMHNRETAHKFNGDPHR